RVAAQPRDSGRGDLGQEMMDGPGSAGAGAARDQDAAAQAFQRYLDRFLVGGQRSAQLNEGRGGGILGGQSYLYPPKWGSKVTFTPIRGWGVRGWCGGCADFGARWDRRFVEGCGIRGLSVGRARIREGVWGGRGSWDSGSVRVRRDVRAVGGRRSGEQAGPGATLAVVLIKRVVRPREPLEPIGSHHGPGVGRLGAWGDVRVRITVRVWPKARLRRTGVRGGDRAS